MVIPAALANATPGLIGIYGESPRKRRHDHLGFDTKIFFPPFIAQREDMDLVCGREPTFRARCVGPVATSDFGHIPPKAERADHAVAVCG